MCRGQEWYFQHTFGGFSAGLHPLLCSHAVVSQASHPASVFLIPSRCWEAVCFSTPASDILYLPWEAGQPCHSNVKHMWNRLGQSMHTRGRRQNKKWPEPNWSFPLCLRINGNETTEMQRQKCNFITPCITVLLPYSDKKQVHSSIELSLTVQYAKNPLWASAR